MSLRAPELLGEKHKTEGFDSGAPSLDDWLARRARANQVSGASRTFVVSDSQLRVVAYFSLASGSIQAIEATGAFRRNMPDPIPIVILARLAVDRSQQGRGVGAGLVGEAGRRVLSAGELIGVRGLVVHALDDRAAAFYRSLGFEAPAGRPLTLMLPLSRLRASL